MILERDSPLTFLFDRTRRTEAYQRTHATPAFEAVLASASRSGTHLLWRRSGATFSRLSLNHLDRQKKRANDLPFQFDSPCFAELREMIGIGKVGRVSFPGEVCKPANRSHCGPTLQKNLSRHSKEFLVLRARRAAMEKNFFYAGSTDLPSTRFHRAFVS